MPRASTTYTTYLRTELDPVTRQSYGSLRQIAESTYSRIATAAAAAGGVTGSAFDSRRASAGFRSLQVGANSTFGNIRREAATTGNAIAAMQAQLSGVRSTAIGGIGNGALGSSGVAAARAAAVANDNLAASARRLTTTTTTAELASRRHARSLSDVTQQTSRLSRGLEVAGTTLSVVQGPLGPIAGRVSAISAAVQTLGTGTLVLAGAVTALFAFAGVANVYAQVESRLKPLYDTQQQVNGALRETGRLALATRTALAPTADLYAKLTSAGRDYNLSAAQVSRITETANKAATLSGGSSASREAGLYQFSQGLSSGRLGGDELRSVLENIPELARAIAQGFKNADGSIGTTIGQLRKLGAEGQLSTAKVVDALERSGDIIDAKFAKLPATISSAQTQFATTFTLMIGQADKAIGVTSLLAQTILVAADNMRTLVAIGGTLGAAFIIPKLTGFILDLRTAVGLNRQLAAQSRTALLAGTASPVSFTPTGRELNSARGDLARSGSALTAANEKVAAQTRVVAAIDAEVAATRLAGEADREKARAAQANARFEVAASTQRVEALRAELAQIEQNRIAAQSSVNSFVSARPFVQRQQPGETAATRGRLVAEFDQAESAAKKELAIATLRADAAARRFATAQAEQAVATQAATEATVLNTTAANNNARRGLALLSVQEQRIAATVALEAAEVEAAAASAAGNAAMARASIAQRALAASSTFAAAAMGRLRGAAAAVSSFLGGPFNIAMIAATGLFIYLASQSNAALDAVSNFSGGQEELYKRLGLTTQRLREQSDAARELAETLAEANVQKARTARVDANADLAKSLRAVADGLTPGTAVLDPAQRQKAATVNALASQLASGSALAPAGISFLRQLQKSDPDAFKSSGLRSGLLGAFGGRPDDTAEKLLGVEAARLSQKDAEKNLTEIRAELAKPRTPPKPTAPLTRDQIIAQGRAQAAEVVDPRAAAEDKRKDAYDRLFKQKDLVDAERVEKAAEIEETYNREIALIGKRNQALEARDARRAAAEERKADAQKRRDLAAEEAAANAASRATEKLADVRARYDLAPKLADQVANDQRAIQALVGQEVNITNPAGEVVGRRKFRQDEADTDIARAQGALLKPFQDVTQEYERQANVQALLLQGKDDEAEALQRAYQLIDTTGRLQEGQYEDLVRAAAAQRGMNDALADRERIVSNLRGAVDDVRQTAVQFLNELPSGAARAGGNALKGLLAGFTQRSNQLLVDRLLGGVQQRIDDLISGKTALQNATTFTAQQATRTGGIIQRFGDTIDTVIARVNGVVSNIATGGPIGGATGPFGADYATRSVDTASIGTEIATGLAASMGAILGGAAPVATAANGTTDDGTNIVVQAVRRVTNASERQNRASAPRAGDSQPGKPLTLREIYNESGRSLGEKLDKALGTKFAAGVGAKLGDALQGAGRGSFASSIADAVGIKQSKTGAQIGGAVGAFLPIPFGAEIGGLVGGTVGGLFKKTKQASATLSFDGTSGQLVGNTAVGRGRDEKAQATALGGALADRVNAIAEALGGTVTGAGSVSIGYRPGHKDPAYRVDTTGRGKLTGVLAFATEEEAIAAAVKDLVGDGVIGGISAASSRILQSGQDLAKALDKALLIESIPKRLKAIQDPVGAAVEDLNKEFTKIIAALNEGQGTAEQYAQAQQLYDLERARTIKEAQTAASTAISDYLKEINNTAASPLSKGTVYDNALAEFNKVTTDKASTPEQLVTASKALFDASQRLNGSSSDFFTDFTRVNAVLTDAQKALGQVDAAGGSTLPSSPFSSQAVTDALGRSSAAQVGAVIDQTAILSARLDRLTDAVLASGGSAYDSGGGYSSFDNLAAFR